MDCCLAFFDPSQFLDNSFVEFDKTRLDLELEGDCGRSSQKHGKRSDDVGNSKCQQIENYGITYFSCPLIEEALSSPFRIECSR
jgi:hypothetical protein